MHVLQTVYAQNISGIPDGCMSFSVVFVASTALHVCNVVNNSRAANVHVTGASKYKICLEIVNLIQYTYVICPISKKIQNAESFSLLNFGVESVLIMKTIHVHC